MVAREQQQVGQQVVVVEGQRQVEKERREQVGLVRGWVREEVQQLLVLVRARSERR